MKRVLILAACSVATGAIAGHELDDRDLTNGQAHHLQMTMGEDPHH